MDVPVKADSPINFLGLPTGKLETLLAQMGAKPYRAGQIMKWIHHRNHDRFEHMSDLSKALRRDLADIGEIREPEVVSETLSSDGTRKWLIKAESGSAFETVFIPEEKRGTLCVSSQVGCALDCSFCFTGKQGFNSNLTAAEIVGQVRIARQALAAVYPEREKVITNIVLMGMGEPLLNLENVLDAIDLMLHDLAYGVSKRRLTVSTAGVVPGIEKMTGRTDVALAISLHAPNDELRDQLVPINKKYPIALLLDACRKYLATLGEKRTITIEYVLLAKVNDQPEHARELAKILKHLSCKINLIPFNPFPGSGYHRPGNIAVRAFQARLVDAGYSVTVRTTRGADIQAACGQLVGEVNDRTKRQERFLSQTNRVQVVSG